MLLVRSEILRLLVNTLTSNHKYSFDKMEKFRQHVPMKLSQKPKPFSEFLIAFFSKYSEFDADFQNAMKNPEKDFGF